MKTTRPVRWGLCCLMTLSGMSTFAADQDARLMWANQLTMSPMVSGVVAEVRVVPGQMVEKGHKMVLLDAREFRAKLMRSQARVNAEQANYDEAKRHAERGEELYDRGALSGLATDQRKIAAVNSKAAWSAAVAARDLAKLDLERSEMRAPFAAKVMSVSAVPGQTVITRFEPRPLLTIVANDRMRARTLVSAGQLALLEPGMALKVKVGNQNYEGKVVVLGVDPEGTSNYRLEVEFQYDPAQALKAGQTAVLVLP